MLLIQTIALCATFAVLVVYTTETYRLRKRAQEADTFNALMKIHGRLTSDESCRARRDLHIEFSTGLEKTVETVFGGGLMSNRDFEFSKLQGAVKPHQSDKFVMRLDQRLLSPSITRGKRVSALYVVERVLQDFVGIALPYYLGIPAAKEAAKAWRSVLEDTAPIILPFVAVQTCLRAQKARGYQKHYLFMLSDLGIDLQGVPVPR